MTKRDARYPREIVCLSCRALLPNHEFRGRSIKTSTCKECEALNPLCRWCLDCEAWVSSDDFYWNDSSQRFQGSRCKPCAAHRSHGVTRKFMNDLTGNATPRCSACGDPERLSIDHDHRHCDKETGCEYCVRGYLCRSCNVAEGLLKTIDRATALVAYMESSRLTTEQLAALPPSSGGGRKRPPRKSVTQPHEFYTYPAADRA